MRKLLSAGFARLWKNKIFWAGQILISGVIVLAMVSNYRQQQYYDFTYTSDTFIPGCYMFIGCFTAVFAALFLGTEYSDGTIRNKLIAGHGRIDVYLSSLLLTITASLLVCAVSTLVSLAVAIPLFGPPVNLPLLLLKIALGSLLVLSFAALFTLLAMLIHNKALLSITAVLTFFLLLFAALFVMQRLEEPEYITGQYSMAINGELVQEDPVPNPSYLRGTKRAVYEFLQDFLPTGQTFLLTQGDGSGSPAHPLRMALCSLLLALANTLGGILAFRRKDIN